MSGRSSKSGVQASPQIGTAMSDNTKLLEELDDEGSNSDCKWQAAAVIRALEAELRDFKQSVLDPENQPSQHGTVTLEYHERELAAARLSLSESPTLAEG